MELDKIKLTVLNQLINATGLYSLKLQNHLYGCFIIMEDIAQGVVKVDANGMLLVAPKYTFNLDKQFGEIGIRYGFAMDTKLVLNETGAAYKAMWLHIFTNTKSVADSDQVEDCINEIILKNVKAEDAFFLNALETGSLPQEWIERVFALLSQPPTPPNTPESGGGRDGAAVVDGEAAAGEPVADVAIDNTALAKAATETPMHTSHHTRGRLAHTRRAKNSGVKKNLAKTRRHVR